MSATLFDTATIADRFSDFIARRPEFVPKLIELARQVKARGKRCGMKLLFEQVRWFYFMERDECDEFAVNNSFSSRAARLVMEKAPDLAGFFELRQLKAE